MLIQMGVSQGDGAVADGASDAFAINGTLSSGLQMAQQQDQFDSRRPDYGMRGFGPPGGDPSMGGAFGGGDPSMGGGPGGPGGPGAFGGPGGYSGRGGGPPGGGGFSGR